MKWQKGPPPSIGWWPASAFRDRTILRWWNGRYWSSGVWVYGNESEVASAAKQKGASQKAIEWLPRPKSWPQRSRT